MEPSNEPKLTDEQIRRMEENRRIARERLAKNKERQKVNLELGAAPPPPLSGSNVQGPIASTSVQIPPPTSALTEQESLSRSEQNRLKALAKLKAKGEAPVASLILPSSSCQQQQPNHSNNNNPQPKKPAPVIPNKPPVKGICVLTSRDRFHCKIPFNPHYIEYAKTIPGNAYDPSTKNWSFPLANHDLFIQKSAPLKPTVDITPIPYFLIRALKKTYPPMREDIFDDIDPTLVRALLPFQREGIQFGISRNGNILLADDMGLGKTIQSLGIAHYYYSEWPLLIITPSSMRYNWREAIQTWLPSVPFGAVTIVEAGDQPILGGKVIIMSYDLVSKYLKRLDNIRVVIADESHLIKNYKSVRTRAAQEVLKNASRAILLTGTPALSRPIELFTQISSIDEKLVNVKDFGIRFCNGFQGNFGWDYSGSSNMDELQIFLKETLMLRRLKSDVLSQLPAKRREMILLDHKLLKKTPNFKARAEEFGALVVKTHSDILAFYIETASAKVEAVKQYIQELVETGRKFLCFVHHKLIMDSLSYHLESINCRYIRIDGSTSSEHRKEYVDKFQYNDSIQVALLSITACSTGITLTAASLVVFAELFWNPGVLTQAEDRAHRIGQEDSVLVRYLVAKGTSDDYLWAMLQDKLETLNQAGLSKDNFKDANSNAVRQQVPSTSTFAHNSASNSIYPSTNGQRKIEEFFPSSQSPPKPVPQSFTQEVGVSSEEIADIFAGLDEEESFNSGDTNGHSNATADTIIIDPEESSDSFLEAALMMEAAEAMEAEEAAEAMIFDDEEEEENDDSLLAAANQIEMGLYNQY